MRIKDLIIFIMLNYLYIGTTLKNFMLFVKKIKKNVFYVCKWEGWKTSSVV